MLKRLTWMTMGTGFGFGLALWCRRAVRIRVERYRPSQASQRIARSLRGAGERLRGAADDGRRAMHEREQQLRGCHAATGGEGAHR